MKIKVAGIGILFGLFFVLTPHLSAQSDLPDFTAIDTKVGRSPKSLAKDLPTLTAWLTEGTDSELEKVRAIYRWITSHIGYDWKAAQQDKRINHFISDILERKLALCFGYAQLFQKMCELAGIESVLINGYAKGTVDTQMPLQVPNHSWNAVKINGDWYLLDATWGTSTSQEQNSFVLISNNDYFLVNPEQFVRTHLPGNPMWQLLPHPVPAATFMHSDSAVTQHLAAVDSTFAFRDSLAAFLRLSPDRQRLQEYEYTYQSYPTTANGTQLGHALIDYAGMLSDSLEQFSSGNDRQKILQFNTAIVLHCRRAALLTTLYPWQQELLINALINQAVFQYNWPEETGKPVEEVYDKILALLEEAREWLNTATDSYFCRIARQQCEQYIEIVNSDRPSR